MAGTILHGFPWELYWAMVDNLPYSRTKAMGSRPLQFLGWSISSKESGIVHRPPLEAFLAHERSRLSIPAVSNATELIDLLLPNAPP